VSKILIVDDDPDIQEMCSLVLTKEGFEVVCASNRAEGFKTIAAGAPDLLILDVMMEEPDDGLRFARQARRQGNMLPILMVTSVNRAMGLQIGKDEEMVPVDEFIEKPVDPATLVAKVNALLAEREDTSW